MLRDDASHAEQVAELDRLEKILAEMARRNPYRKDVSSVLVAEDLRTHHPTWWNQ